MIIKCNYITILSKPILTTVNYDTKTGTALGIKFRNTSAFIGLRTVHSLPMETTVSATVSILCYTVIVARQLHESSLLNNRNINESDVANYEMMQYSTDHDEFMNHSFGNRHEHYLLHHIHHSFIATSYFITSSGAYFITIHLQHILKVSIVI